VRFGYQLVHATRAINPYVRREHKAAFGLPCGRNRALEQRPKRRQPSRERRVDAEHRGVGAGHRAHGIVDACGIADDGCHSFRQRRAFRISHQRDDVMLCGKRCINDVASEPATCTEHGDPHALRSFAHNDPPPATFDRHWLVHSA
jgi:hypothetical protein